MAPVLRACFSSSYQASRTLVEPLWQFWSEAQDGWSPRAPRSLPMKQEATDDYNDQPSFSSSSHEPPGPLLGSILGALSLVFVLLIAWGIWRFMHPSLRRRKPPKNTKTNTAELQTTSPATRDTPSKYPYLSPDPFRSSTRIDRKRPPRIDSVLSDSTATSGSECPSPSTPASPAMSTFRISSPTYLPSPPSPVALSPPPIATRVRRDRNRARFVASTSPTSSSVAQHVIGGLVLAAAAVVRPLSSSGRQQRPPPPIPDILLPIEPVPAPTSRRKRVPSPSKHTLPDVASPVGRLPDEFTSQPLKEQLEELQREVRIRRRSRDGGNQPPSHDPPTPSFRSPIKRPSTAPIQSSSELYRTRNATQRPLEILSDEDISRIIGSLAERMKWEGQIPHAF